MWEEGLYSDTLWICPCPPLLLKTQWYPWNVNIIYVWGLNISDSWPMANMRVTRWKCSVALLQIPSGISSGFEDRLSWNSVLLFHTIQPWGFHEASPRSAISSCSFCLQLHPHVNINLWCVWEVIFWEHCGHRSNRVCCISWRLVFASTAGSLHDRGIEIRTNRS